MKTAPAHDATIIIRMSKADKDRLQRAAMSDMMSVSDYVRKQLHEAYNSLSDNNQENK